MQVCSADRPPGDPSTSEAGFSLVEVIVAMVLLGILATVTLPFFITGIRVTADDSATTTATARVGALIEQARTRTCAQLNALAAANQGADFTDAHGRRLKLTMTMDPAQCTAVPVRLAVTVKATNDAGTATLSSASTIIYVTS
jgi:prepilin-type N-terminal cleavage/methylation domain-containing protein